MDTCTRIHVNGYIYMYVYIYMWYKLYSLSHQVHNASSQDFWSNLPIFVAKFRLKIGKYMAKNWRNSWLEGLPVPHCSHFMPILCPDFFYKIFTKLFFFSIDIF